MRKSGFTLIEITLTVVIVSVISIAIFNTFLVGKRSWGIGSTQVAVQQAARLAIDTMSRELTFSSPKEASIGLLGDTISFRTPSDVDTGGSITWSNLIQYSLNAGQLLRTLDGQTKVLANDIQSLQFTPLGSRRIDITVVVQKSTIDDHNIQYTLSSQVYLRND